MSKKTVGVVVIGVVVLGMVVSQQIGRTAPALTALDYAEIQQLYARYAFAGDMPTDDGDMYARTYTNDGVFSSPAVRYEGYEELKAAVEALDIHTPRHYTTNILIEPTAEGAMGAAYLLIVADAEDDSRQRSPRRGSTPISS